MRRSRLAVLVFGSALAVGGVTSTAFARSDDTSSSTPSSTSASVPTSTPNSTEAENHTTTTGGPMTLNVAGVGTVTFSVDPTTAAISDVVVTPIDGVSTGAPVATPDGVRIQVTTADGTVRVLKIKARHEDAGLEVETEVEIENENEVENEVENERHDRGDDHGADADQNRGPGSVNSGPGRVESGDHRDDGPDHDTATTAAPGVFSPSAGDDHGANSGRDGSGDNRSGDDGSGRGDSGGSGGRG